VPINCAAIPAELLEAELFGIGPRVASGVAGRTGKLAEAEGGTLFLDEVAEMPAELQAKLLRVLQEGVLEPLGLPPRKIDVRVVAATNANLDGVLDSGKLRRDLYYRLAGFVLQVPSLRERREDVPPLVEAFVQRFAVEQGKPIRGISVRAMEILMAEDWPGNVRELKSAVERLVWSCPPFQAIDGGLVERIARGPALRTGAGGRAGMPPAPAAVREPSSAGGAPAPLHLERLEKDAIVEAMRLAGSNQVRAALLLGISRHRLRRRLKHFGLLEGEGERSSSLGEKSSSSSD
jgi:DNA-binding NtrC family response regulator